MTDIINTNIDPTPTEEERELITSASMRKILDYLEKYKSINRDIAKDVLKLHELSHPICGIEDKGYIIDRKPIPGKRNMLNYILVGWEKGHKHIPTKRKRVVTANYEAIITREGDKLRVFVAHDTPETQAVLKALSALSGNSKLITSGNDAQGLSQELLIPLADLRGND